MPTKTRERPHLRVHELPANDRPEAALLRFEALTPGEAFELVDGRPLKPVLVAFQRDCWGEFDWTFLEAGQTRYRVEIKRRSAKGPADLSEYLTEEHRRFDSLLEEVRRLIDARRFGEARQRFSELTCALAMHAAAEDAILFPRLEAIIGARRGPTPKLVHQHGDLRQLWQVATAAIESGMLVVAADGVGKFAKQLRMHQRDEEAEVYRFASILGTSKASRLEIVRAMQAFDGSS